jgi:serine/threonine protein kinase
MHSLVRACNSIVVGQELAQGGFSFVHRARDAMTGEAFALKKILCQTDEQMQAAKQEIQTHKAFDHPNIMPLADYAVVTVDGSTHEYYLLFPFMEVRLPDDKVLVIMVANECADRPVEQNGTLREMIDVTLRYSTNRSQPSWAAMPC